MNDLWLISEAGWQGYLSRMIHKQAQMKSLATLNPMKAKDRKELVAHVQGLQGMKLWYDDEEDDDVQVDGDREPSPYELAGAYHYMVDIKENVAVLHISGTLISDYHWYNRIFDEISYPEIISSIDYLMGLHEAGTIDTVVVNYNTPGGAVHGIETAAHALETMGKSLKMVSHAETQMTSGGVWLGVSAKHISANRMAVIASIGVIAIHMSYNRMLTEAGIDATVMRSGSEKALGTAYEAYDDKAKAIMQESMDLVHQEFKTRVGEGRSLTPAQVETISTGRSFMAFQPEVSILIDEITTLDAVVAKHVAVHNPRTSATNFNLSPVQIIGEGAGTMKVKVLNAKGQAAVAAGLTAEKAFLDASMYEERDATAADKVDDKGNVVDDGKDKDNKDKDETNKDVVDKDGKNDVDKPGVTDDATKATQTRLDESLKANGKLEAKIEQLEAEIVAGKEALTLANAAASSLEVIARTAINKMEVALGTSTSDESLKGAAIVARHTQITEKFEKTFSIGAKATVPADQDLSARGGDADADELNRRLGKK